MMPQCKQQLHVLESTFLILLKENHLQSLLLVWRVNSNGIVQFLISGFRNVLTFSRYYKSYQFY